MPKTDKKLCSTYLEHTLYADARALATRYRLSFNMLVTLLLEDAVERGEVPGMADRDEQGNIISGREEEQSLDKP